MIRWKILANMMLLTRNERIVGPLFRRTFIIFCIFFMLLFFSLRTAEKANDSCCRKKQKVTHCRTCFSNIFIQTESILFSQLEKINDRSMSQCTQDLSFDAVWKELSSVIERIYQFQAIDRITFMNSFT